MSATQPSTPPSRRARLVARSWACLVDTAVDKPVIVSGVLAVVTATHGSATWLWPWLNPYKALAVSTNLGTAVTIYLFTAAAAALVASLAGIILVFVIGGQTPQLRLFRSEAGLPLRRTWVAVVAEPFVAAVVVKSSETVDLTELAVERVG